jgi:hypothetical protein
MKNRDENTTFLQFSYSGFTIFERFFEEVILIFRDMGNSAITFNIVAACYYPGSCIVDTYYR